MAIWMVFKMGLFVIFPIHPDVSGFRFAQHTEGNRRSLRLFEPKYIKYYFHEKNIIIRVFGLIMDEYFD